MWSPGETSSVFGPQVSVVGETVNVSGQSSCTPVKVPSCHLSDDLGALLDQSGFSDVILCVSGREFQAHKAILAGGSMDRSCVQL